MDLFGIPYLGCICEAVVETCKARQSSNEEKEREREREPGALGLRTVSCGQDLLSHAMHGPLTCVIKYRDRKYQSQPITILHARSHDHVAHELERERNCLYRTLA